MKIYRKINFKTSAGKQEEVVFGVPGKEKEDMFRLRFDIYSKKGYIDPKAYPDGLEKDEYDIEDKSLYLIAKIRDHVVGTLRIIKDDPLPTERDCFDFDEPEDMVSIPSENRAEMGRLIAKGSKVNGEYIPRHLVMLGLFSVALDIFEREDVRGGYSFIKESLEVKLEKLGVPFYRIDNYESKYKEGVLEGYFNQENDKVIPMYFLTETSKIYWENFVQFPFFFRKTEEGMLYKGVNVLTLALFSIYRLFNKTK